MATETSVWTLQEVMSQLKAMGSPQTVKIYENHGAVGDMYGVKIADLKKVLKHVKGNPALIADLWDTGNSDAMYLAGLAADGASMSKKQLDHWAKTAWWYMLSEYAVPFAAAEHPDALQLAAKWIKSKQSNVASSGWSTYANVLSVWPDERLNPEEIRSLLAQAEASIQDASGRVRYCMNGFVICVGTYFKPLLVDAKRVAKRIGKIEVDMGNTACKVPVASEVIKKVEDMQRIGRKRKSTKC